MVSKSGHNKYQIGSVELSRTILDCFNFSSRAWRASFQKLRKSLSLYTYSLFNFVLYTSVSLLSDVIFWHGFKVKQQKCQKPFHSKVKSLLWEICLYIFRASYILVSSCSWVYVINHSHREQLYWLLGLGTFSNDFCRMSVGQPWYIVNIFQNFVFFSSGPSALVHSVSISLYWWQGNV